MAIRSAQVAIATTATLMAVGNSGGSRVYLHQGGNSNHDVYVGGSTVTVNNGFQLHKGSVTDVYLPEGEALYGISTTGETIFVLQTGGK